MKLPHHNRKVIIAIITVAVVLLAAGGVYAYQQLNNSQDSSKKPTATTQDRPVGDVNYGAPTSEEQNPTVDQQSNTAPDTSKTSSDPINTAITYAGGSPLQVRVIINEILSTGSCTLHVYKSGSEIYSEKVDVFPTSSSTTCKGFTVNSPSVTNGAYKVQVDVVSNNRQGSATKDITL